MPNPFGPKSQDLQIGEGSRVARLSWLFRDNDALPPAVVVVAGIMSIAWYTTNPWTTALDIGLRTSQAGFENRRTAVTH